MDYTTEGMHISNNDDESSAVPAPPAVESNVVADSDMQQQQQSSSSTPAPEAPLADHESDDDEPDAAPDAAEEEIVANDYEAVATAAVVSDLPSEQSEAAGATAANESAPSAENSGTAENVSNNPLLNEINDYSHQLYRIIMLCRRKITANSQAHSTIIGLDAALARMPSNTMSLVNTMLEIFTSLIINVPDSQDMFDIETIREDLFRFYNLEHILASRCRRCSRGLASKRHRQHHSSS